MKDNSVSVRGSFKDLFLRTNTSESERLAVCNGSFTVFGVTTIHAKVLMFVRGFDTQVRLNPVVVQVYDRVQERYFFCLPGGSKFDGRVVMVKALNKSSH